jgi:hypothetical protein
MQSLILTDYQKQYVNAPRAINQPEFPTPGYYFIRGIKEKTDSSGNIYPSASVNWKLKEDDSWEDCIENRFYLRLDYLLGAFGTKPKVSYQDLRHQVIHVKSAYISNTSRGSKPISKIVANWEITLFEDIFDTLPYFSLFNKWTLAMEDAKFEDDEVGQLAIMSDEFDEQILDEDEEPLADDFEDEDNIVDPNED